MGAEAAGLALDGALAGLAVAIGWRASAARNRFESVALFVALGLVMSIAWIRLDAPDLALAEAALGAGLTGALLLAAWAETEPRAPRERAGAAPRRVRALAAGLALATMALAGAALAPLAAGGGGLAAEVAVRIGETGVRHPVTAVLVDFRAFDTLLELCVLLAALVATWQIGPARALLRAPARGPVFVAYARLALPALVVLAGVLLWRGASAPGGAFQAGATLAAAGVLALLASATGAAPHRDTAYRIGACLGVAAFLGLGLGAGAVTGRFLDWPQAAAGALVLAAEAAATIAIGVTLALLLVAGRPAARADDRPEIRS